MNRSDSHTCWQGNEYVIVTGNYPAPQNSCERYSVKDDTWEELPDLNYGRNCHSSIVFEDRICYVFFGEDIEEGGQNTIERLDLSAGQKAWKWDLIKRPSIIPQSITAIGCQYAI